MGNTFMRKIEERCDDCGAKGETHRLEYEKDVGARLCKKCWEKEMRWRKQQNKLLPLQKRLEIISFPK